MHLYHSLRDNDPAALGVLLVMAAIVFGLAKLYNAFLMGKFRKKGAEPPKRGPGWAWKQCALIFAAILVLALLGWFLSDRLG